LYEEGGLLRLEALFWQASGHDIPADLGYRDRHHPVCLTLPRADQMRKNRRQVDLRWVEGGQLITQPIEQLDSDVRADTAS